MAVGWAVSQPLVGVFVAGPTGADYLGGNCLPSLAQLAVRAFRYVDNHALPLRGLERIGGGVLWISDGDGRATTEHKGRRARQERRSSYCGRAVLADNPIASASSASRRASFSRTA